MKQPWAWAIIHAGKNIENRSRRTRLKETIAIHAPLQPDQDWKEWYPPRALKVPSPDLWEYGAIIGFVDLVGCVEEHRSKWFQGPFGYVLHNPRPLRRPVPCKGARGFWPVDAAIVRHLRSRMK